MSELIDGFGRTVSDLRVSVTDRCNFRCVYCMPEEGVAWAPTETTLTTGEMHRLVDVFASLGVQTLRLTGGEPLLRREIVDIVARLHTDHSQMELSLTTNGFLLRKYAQQLATAGLTRVNVSLDSLQADRFARITRRDALHIVLDGLEAARDAGLHPIKINVVVVRGFNDDELCAFAELARETGISVRFIEYMPLDAGGEWGRQSVVAGDELLEAAESAFPLVTQMRGHEPAARYGFADGSPGELGFINSVTAPFCDRCNRVRLTADGQLRTCLFSVVETDLRTPLRHGADDAELSDLVRAAVLRKEAGHRVNEPDFVRPLRPMSQIGG